MNGQFKKRNANPWPVIKLYLPETGLAWLVTAMNPECRNQLYGLYCHGSNPAMGDFYLDHLLELKNQHGKGIRLDKSFKPKYPISVYARAAYDANKIIEDKRILRKFIK